MNLCGKMTVKTVNAVIIIGGGLVGSLAGIFMAKKGFHVTVFESREDIRSTKFAQGRSINMALSNRGINALAEVGLEKLILESAVPMKGRLLHNFKGKTRSVVYDTGSGQCIHSVNRRYLNKILLSELESYDNVEICFSHKLVNVSIKDGTVTLLNLKNQEMRACRGDLVIGADGAFSTLRRFMQQSVRFEFSQKYIDHGYLELKIPPERGDRMIPNHLHIWPRGEFMMIALPNKDMSWTVTLFMPFTHFDTLKDEDLLVDFFRTAFPDAVSIIGKNALVRDFFRVKPSPLVSIKCNPFHAGGKFLLIGDAAHAIVPFYGQGMNSGFEDCSILNRILDEKGDDVAGSIEEFSAERVKDAHAVCDLAMYNYVEMRDLVTRRSYFLRRLLDELMFKLFPHAWVPLYNSVTFCANISYTQCVENRQWQDKILWRLIWSAILLIVSLALYYFNT